MHSGCNGKFLSVVDLDVKNGRIADLRYRLLPVFSNLIPADPVMAAHIAKVRAPFVDRLEEKLAITESTLYRRGNFSGTFDQLIVDALRAVKGTEFALSPGFRWGTALLPGDTITMERLMDQTAITYPTVLTIERTGADIKAMLEDLADNLFNKDPYMQQGGDMVRIGGLRYAIHPDAAMGQRIGRMETRTGEPIMAGKKYKLATWGTVQPHEPGTPVWDVVAEYLRQKKSVTMSRTELPRIRGLDQNPGIAERHEPENGAVKV
jgi:sulfur-oxidizing protein SoxB